MPAINQDLLERLQSELGVKKARVYARIQEIANKTMLERHLAALVLASEIGISIQKYSTSEDRAQIRSGGPNGTETPRIETVSPAIRPNSRKRTSATRSSTRPKDNSVFVVHGRNDELRRSMFEFLRALGLSPLEWEKAILKAKGANPHIDAILDAAMSSVRAVIVLFSPDDEAKLKDQFCKRGEKKTDGKLEGQPRANVIFEAGLALGRHPEKTLLVQVGKVRGFSDVAGKHVVRLSNDFEKRNDVANRLRKLGCDVDTQGNDWTKAGNFAA